MADIFSKEKRSEIMSRIRSKDTKPETRLYEMVRDIIGNRRKIDRNLNSLPGQPDIFIPSLKLVIFLDGCFYHSCPIHGHLPKTNKKYWTNKLIMNASRDEKNQRPLRSLGYSVWRFWEHDLKTNTSEKTYIKLKNRLSARIEKLH